MAAPAQGCAKVSADGVVTQLDGKATASQSVTEDDVQLPAKLARMLGGLLADVAALRRRFQPRHVDFEDVAVLTTGASNPVQLRHGMGGRVRWWVVGWQCATNAAPIIRESTDSAVAPVSTADTLVLLSYVAGAVTIRVEAAG